MDADEATKVAVNLAACTIDVLVLLIERQPDKLHDHLQALREVAESLRGVASR